MSICIAATNSEREACFVIRKAVFVEEQGVPLALEMDDADATAVHFLVTDDQTGDFLATARLLSKGEAAKIGRVAVIREARGRGIGRALMEFILDYAAVQGLREAVLNAQTTVVSFYENLGFETKGEEFLEAGIPHYKMRRAISKHAYPGL